MGGALRQMLPLALGAAVSPTLLTFELLILAGKAKPKVRAWFYAIGAGLALIIYILLLLTIGQGLSLASSHQSLIERVIKGSAAVALALLGVRAVAHRKAPPRDSRLKDKLAKASPKVFFTVGFGTMASNFSTLVLIIPALHEILKPDLPPDQTATLVLILYLIAMLPALLPVTAATVGGKKVDPVLASMNRFTTKYAPEVNAGIAFFFAILLGYSALKP